MLVRAEQILQRSNRFYGSVAIEPDLWFYSDRTGSMVLWRSNRIYGSVAIEPDQWLLESNKYYGL